MSRRGPVLIVDDSLSVRFFLRDALGEACTTCVLAASCAEAVRVLQREPCAAVVLDLNLPDGSGLTIVPHATSGQPNQIPVVVLSSDDSLPTRVKALCAGATDFIGKSNNVSFLVRRVQELCGRESVSGAEGGPRHILIVDGSPTYGNALGNELRRFGHDVAFAQRPEQALEYVALRVPDGVVLDVQTPEGLELCRRLRGDPRLNDTVLFALGGRDLRELRDVALAAGADELEAKFQDLALLRTRIGELFGTPPVERAQRRIERARSSTGKRRALAERESAPGSPPSPKRVPQLSVFDRVVAACGLSPMVARGLLEKACARAGVSPNDLKEADIARVLPHLKELLALFLTPADAARALENITLLAPGGAG